jgi:tetratricopeptide (TPR) repeat protein
MGELGKNPKVSFQEKQGKDAPQNLDEKIREYDQLLAEDPDNIHVIFARGCALLTAGQVDQAMKDFNRVSGLELALRDHGSTK